MRRSGLYTSSIVHLVWVGLATKEYGLSIVVSSRSLLVALIVGSKIIAEATTARSFFYNKQHIIKHNKLCAAWKACIFTEANALLPVHWLTWAELIWITENSP